MAETIWKSQIILTKYGGPLTKNRNKKIKERERKLHYYICVYNTEEANMTGNIKTDPIITGRSWESCSINRTMVIDIPPLSLNVPISHLSNIFICKTLRLYSYQIKKFGCILWFTEKYAEKLAITHSEIVLVFHTGPPWNMQHHVCWLFTKNIAESVSVHFSTEPQPQQRKRIKHAELSLIQSY